MSFDEYARDGDVIKDREREKKRYIGCHCPQASTLWQDFHLIRIPQPSQRGTWSFEPTLRVLETTRECR